MFVELNALLGADYATGSFDDGRMVICVGVCGQDSFGIPTFLLVLLALLLR